MRVPKTRNLEEWTEARYWQTVRSALRLAFKFWRPLQEAKKRSRKRMRPPSGGRPIYMYKCSKCEGMYREKEVQVDHIIPVGELRCLEDLAPFLERLTSEYVSSYRVLCKDCHQKVTNKERSDKGKTKHGQSYMFD